MKSWAALVGCCWNSDSESRGARSMAVSDLIRPSTWCSGSKGRTAMYDPMNDDDLLQKELDAFDRDPAQEMGRLPVKRDANGELIQRPFTAFAESDLGDGDFVLHRDTVRKSFSAVVDG